MKHARPETVEEWMRRTGKKPHPLPKGKEQPLGKRFKWKDVGKGASDK